MISSRKFLVSVGIALTSLLSNSSLQAITEPVDKIHPVPPVDSASQRLVGQTNKDEGSIVNKLTYQNEGERHLLLLRKASRGAIYADHSSHESHGSHSSHSSGKGERTLVRKLVGGI